MNLYSSSEESPLLPSEIDLNDIFIGREDQLYQFCGHLDRWHRLTRGDLAGCDHLAQNTGQLQVDRLPGEMINGHLASVGIPWPTWDSGAP